MSNEQKTPLARSLPLFTQGLVDDSDAQVGKSVPATVVSVDPTNTIVTVKLSVQLNSGDQPLPTITVPVACPQWIRYPIQPGDKGAVFSTDYYLGQMSDLGNGQATLDQYPNLTNLVWVPLGSAKFATPPFPQALDTNGPEGAVMRSADNAIQVLALKDKGFQVVWNGTPFITVSKDGISIQFDGNGIVINSNGTFIDTATTPYMQHEHSGVQTGGGDTGPVVP